MKSLNCFNVYHSYLEGISALSYEERGRLLTAMLEYSITGENMELTGAERYLFPLMRGQIDRDKQCYEQRQLECSRNGKKGAQKRKEKARKRAAEAAAAPPPTLEEVREYCQKEKLQVNPERFFRYFEAGNWCDSHGCKILSWQQKLLSWNRYDALNAAENQNKETKSTEINLEELKRSIEKL